VRVCVCCVCVCVCVYVSVYMYTYACYDVCRPRLCNLHIIVFLNDVCVCGYVYVCMCVQIPQTEHVKIELNKLLEMYGERERRLTQLREAETQRFSLSHSQSHTHAHTQTRIPRTTHTRHTHVLWILCHFYVY